MIKIKYLILKFQYDGFSFEIYHSGPIVVSVRRYNEAIKKEEWFNAEGKLHRDDGPAVIYPDGTQRWYQNDLVHRVDGPAIIDPDGTQHWYSNNKRHRIGGPAIIHPDGWREWWVDDLYQYRSLSHLY